MNCKRATLLIAAVVLFLPGCATYERSVKQDMEIPFVYNPPSKAYHPYTLMHYKKNSGLQPVCGASSLTGMRKRRLIKKIKAYQIDSTEIKEKHEAEFNIILPNEDMKNFHPKFLKIDRVRVSFKNGHQYTIPNLHIQDVVDRLKSKKCINNIKKVANHKDDSKFYIPAVVYGYDIEYKIFTEDGRDITAKVPESLAKIVLGQIGLECRADKKISLAGNDLYVGFSGKPVEFSIEEIIKRKLLHKPSPRKASRGKRGSMYTLDVTDVDISVLDVTETVQAIINKQASVSK